MRVISIVITMIIRTKKNDDNHHLHHKNQHCFFSLQEAGKGALRERAAQITTDAALHLSVLARVITTSQKVAPVGMMLLALAACTVRDVFDTFNFPTVARTYLNTFISYIPLFH